MIFPIDFSKYKPLVFNLDQDKLTPDLKDRLITNIDLVRDAIIFFTAYANARGLGGHTGGAYDIVPEVLIADGFMRGSDKVYPALFDEAGHRVAIQYCMAALDEGVPGMSLEDLLHYREHGSGLPGHPELDLKRGIKFSSGRLGHLFSHVNGVAEQFPGKHFVLFGSDGAQQEGNDAESARYAVAHQLNVTLIIDDNDVTIEGNPSSYLPGFDVGKTLAGHGMTVDTGDGEDIDGLYSRIVKAFRTDGPVALINKRKMAPTVAGIESSTKGHDAIPVPAAIDYLRKKNLDEAASMLESARKLSSTEVYLGSTPEFDKNRVQFGKTVCSILEKLEPEERKKTLVISSDLGGSCGLNLIGDQFPEIYRLGGVMERNNYSTAAGFGSRSGYQGIFGTFSAFSEMVVSEVTMARLNNANVLAHFSHAGVDDIADNTCHFGINIFSVDSGLPEGDTTRLYFPADTLQMQAVLEKIFHEPGLRFVFSTRSAVPFILKEDGSRFFEPDSGYRFDPDKDEIIRSGTAGYVVSYGEMLYRSLDAVEKLRKENIDIGLINKPTLNHVDENAMKTAGSSGAVLVVESQNAKNGLGVRYGSWLLERGYSPKYAFLGTVRQGDGGIAEQIGYQGLSPADIVAKVKSLL
ncbi:transketolase [candidate division KSB1 bacterium]|nr:transketolase [candidate division KSB1 bacterium]